MTKLVEIPGAVAHAAQRHGLDIVGHLPATADDPVPPDTKTIVLLGPKEPGFWAHLTGEPEFGDALPDPVDRWSKRVITALAASLNARAIFPFGSPPYAPFIAWALRCGRVWSSPVGLLVHDQAGLFVSFRGAICLPYEIAPHANAETPCTNCASKPCQTACPVAALSRKGYDTDACHAFLDTAAGADCMQNGCAVRRSCPVSKTYPRTPAQSALHMKAFHP